jgi:hypothetical protein
MTSIKEFTWTVLVPNHSTVKWEYCRDALRLYGPSGLSFFGTEKTDWIRFTKAYQGDVPFGEVGGNPNVFDWPAPTQGPVKHATVLKLRRTVDPSGTPGTTGTECLWEVVKVWDVHWPSWYSDPDKAKKMRFVSRRQGTYEAALMLQSGKPIWYWGECVPGEEPWRR